jgi:hypothetical protein
MALLDRLLPLPAAALGLVLSSTLYLNVVAIGPVELLESLLLTIPLAVILLRLMRSALGLRPSRPRSGARTAGSARRSR